MERCKHCGKELSGKRGLAGHLWIVHRERTGFMAEYDRDKVQFLASLDAIGKRLDSIKIPVVDGRFADLKHTHPIPSHPHSDLEDRLVEVGATLKEIERMLKSHTHEVLEHKHKSGMFDNGGVDRA